MKKSLIAGAASLALAAMPAVSTFALDPGSYTQDATVGEVDETTYSVGINWGDMVFDWKYNRTTNDFNFEAHHTCRGAVYNNNMTDELDEAKSLGRLYSESTCSTLETGELVSGNTYYELSGVPDGQIVVEDHSTNGKVKVSASFLTEDDYSWVTGKFGTWTAIGGGNGPFDDYTEFNEFTNGVFPRDELNTGDIRILYGHLRLEKSANVPTGAYDSILENDRIGTVTITIEPDLN